MVVSSGVKCEHCSHFKDAHGSDEDQEQCSHFLRRRVAGSSSWQPPPRAAPELGKRARNRAVVEARSSRWRAQHLATQGAAALSLRAIARDLGMVSSGHLPLRREPRRAAHPPHRRLLHLADPRGAGGARRRAAPRPGRPMGCGRPRAARLGDREPPRLRPALRLSRARLRGARRAHRSRPGTAVLAILVGLLDDARRAGCPRRPRAPRPAPDDVETAVRPLLGDADVRRHPTSTPMALARDCAPGPCCSGAVTSEIFGQLGPLPDAGALFAVLLAAGRSTFLTDPVNDPDRE